MRDTADAASKDAAANFLRDLGDAISRNPLPAALVGMGVVWLFSGRKDWAAGTVRSGLDWASDAANDAADAAGSTMRTGAQYAGAMRDKATRFAGEQADALSDVTTSLPEEGTELTEGVRSGLTDLFQRQPLALGAIGFAIGAGIAAVLPSTRTEADYLGEASDAAKEMAQEFAGQQAARARRVGEKALDAAAEEARKQHLTMEDARSAAGKAAEKLDRVADAAAQAASAKADATY